VQVERRHPLLEGLRENDELYFVHSYYLAPTTDEHVYATTEHGIRFCVAVGKNNLFATQFHPEKSGHIGLSLLSRFATWDGSPC